MRVRFSGLIMLLALLLSGCGLGRTAQEMVGRQVGSLLVRETGIASSISEDRYAYEQLDAETQVVYDQILQCILSHEEKVTVSTNDSEVLRRAYECILMDYGGLFWISGYQYNTYTSFGAVVGMEFQPHYIYTADETRELQTEVDAVVEEWMAGISLNDDDYEKAKYVFETLIDRVDYRQGSRDNQNILSVFLYGETVCQGYADAAQYLLQNLGISSTVVIGNADGGNHAWNMVRLDGNYYYMDVTWGNSKYHSAEEEEKKHVNYAYLNTTLEDISKSHQADVPVDLPQSGSMEDTYFVREGLYYETFDPGAIGSRIQSAWWEGRDRISIRLADETTHDKTLEYFVTDKHIFSYCPGLSSISYLDGESLGIITFIFP